MLYGSVDKEGECNENQSPIDENAHLNGDGGGDDDGRGEGEDCKLIEDEWQSNWVWSLAASHTLSTAGVRMWEFCVAVLQVSLFPSSLRPVAIYGLLEALLSALLGPKMGRIVDDHSRYTVQMVSLTIQDLCTAAAALCFYAALGHHETSTKSTQTIEIIWFAGVCLFGSIANAASSLSTLSCERDWVVAMTHTTHDQGHVMVYKRRLSWLNALLMRIDLMSKAVAPIAAGFIADWINPRATALCMALFNLLTLPIELLLVHRLYYSCTKLHRKTMNHVDQNNNDDNENAEGKPNRWMDRWMESFKLYGSQSTFLVSIAYALLYISILNMGSITTTYLRWKGLSNSLLASIRAAAAICGLSSTLIVPRLPNYHNRITLYALLSISLQLVCLTPLTFALLFNWSNSILIATLTIGITFSRIGLWSFDLVEREIMQTWIPNRIRGRVSGVESTLTNIAYMIGFALVAGQFASPTMYEIPAIASYACVFIATMLTAIFALRYCHPINDQERIPLDGTSAVIH